MGPFEYILLVLVSLTLLTLIFLIVLVLKRKGTKTETQVDIALHDKIFELKHEIDDLTEELKQQVKITLLEHNVKESQKDAENSKKLTDEIQNKLADLNKGVKDALVGANAEQSKLLTDLGKQIEALSHANKEVSSLGNTVQQLTQVITGNNQKRGQFGEFLLTSVLENIFESTPDMFDTQYDLTNRNEKVRVDAVIHLPRDKGNILPIDAKFPYANYINIFDENGKEDEAKVKEFKDDVKKKIDDISKKYIIEGTTTDYALCYFPSDEIYNYVNSNLHDIAELARKKNVILVSPATLQPVLFTLRALMIEYKRSEKLQELNASLRVLAKDFGTLRERWEKIKNNVNTLSNSVTDFNTTYTRLDTRFERISEAAEIDEVE